MPKRVFGRKISFDLPQKNRVVIFDQCGAETVRQLADDPLIPSIATRGEVYYVNPLELAIAFVMWIRCCIIAKQLKEVGISLRQRVTISRMAARIWLYSPRTVLTFIDNQKAFSALHIFFKGRISFAALVNGTRGIPNYDIEYKLCYDVLFSHGDSEGELARIYGHKFNSIIPIGSPKLLLFLRNHIGLSTIQEATQGLCLISQFRLGIEAQHNTVPVFSAFVNLCEYLARFCILTNRPLSILGASNADSEVQFFNRLFLGVKMDFIPKEPGQLFANYSAGMRASALVTVHSTLGQELFGAGKKVMFASCLADRRHDAMVGTYRYVLRSNSFQNFSAMLEEILAYPAVRFSTDFEIERKFICRCNLSGIKTFQDWLSR